MKKEVKIFLTAVMYFTRIPCPAWIDHKPELLEKAIRYFPMIGCLVGCMTVLGLYLFSEILPIPIAIILSMAMGLLITGALHEDGFADVCDGFGGGWTREKILQIMKDSSIGSYGTLGLILLLLLKYACIAVLEKINVSYCYYSLCAGPALSRFAAIGMSYQLNYVRLGQEAKAFPVTKPGSVTNLLIAFVFGILPLFLIQKAILLLVLLPVLILLLYLRNYFYKRIGGYTGDCLGACQQLSELVIYLSLIVLWKYL